MALTYKLSNGFELKNPDATGYHVEMDWCGKNVMTHFMLDDGVKGSAGSAVKLFEQVYEMREYYIMMAQHAFQVYMINLDSYQPFADDIRGGTESVWETDVFRDLLVGLEVRGIAFGNNGKIHFQFYDNLMEDRYRVSGTLYQEFVCVGLDEDEEY